MSSLINKGWLSLSDTERFYVRNIMDNIFEAAEFWADPREMAGMLWPPPHYTFIKQNHFYRIDVSIRDAVQSLVSVTQTKMPLRGFLDGLYSRRWLGPTTTTVKQYCETRNLAVPGRSSWFSPVLNTFEAEVDQKVFPVRDTMMEQFDREIDAADRRRASFRHDMQNKEKLDFLRSVLPGR